VRNGNSENKEGDNYEVTCYVDGLKSYEHLGIKEKIKSLIKPEKPNIRLTDTKITIRFNNNDFYEIDFKDIDKVELIGKSFFERRMIDLKYFMIFIFIVLFIFSIYMLKFWIEPLEDLMRGKFSTQIVIRALTFLLLKRITAIISLIIFVILLILIISFLLKMRNNEIRKGTIILSVKNIPNKIKIGPFQEANLWERKIKSIIAPEEIKPISKKIRDKVTRIKTSFLRKLKG